MNEEGVYAEITIEKLKAELDRMEIKYQPNTEAEIEAARTRLGGLPKLIEEYYTQIGYFDEISQVGMGCHFDELSDIYIETAEEIKAEYEGCENEVDDYLVFGREAVSVDEFVIKVKDFGVANPKVYSHYDLEEVVTDQGLLCGPLTDIPNVASFFSLVLEGAEDAHKYL